MDRRIYLSETNKNRRCMRRSGEYFRIDPTIIRILWVLTVFLSIYRAVAYFYSMDRDAAPQ